MNVGLFSSPLVIGVLLLLALSGVAWASWMRRRKVSVTGEPGCGACGYSTRGLTTLTCPECGSDLRKVGIATATPAGRGYVTFILAAAFFTLVAFIAMKVLSFAFLPLMHWQTTYSTETTLTPGSDANRRYVISCNGPVGGVAPVTIETFVVPKWISHKMTFDPASGGYSYSVSGGPTTRAAKDFGPEAVHAWMTAVGIDTKKSETAMEAARLAGLARKAGRIPEDNPALGIGSGTRSNSGNAGIFTATNMSYGTSTQGMPVLMAVVPAFWIALWLVMLIVLWKSLGPRTMGPS